MGEWLRRALLGALAFYRRWLSPLKRRPTCRYLPTCSEYATEAVEKYGAWKGFWKATWRVCRCHPFGGHGYDPP